MIEKYKKYATKVVFLCVFKIVYQSIYKSQNKHAKLLLLTRVNYRQIKTLDSPRQNVYQNNCPNLGTKNTISTINYMIVCLLFVSIKNVNPFCVHKTWSNLISCQSKFQLNKI